MTEFSIYQINTDRDNNRVCFLGLDSLERFQHSKEVDPALYDRVYDGKLDCNYYLAYMLRSESTRAKIILLAQGISRYNISKNKVMEIAVSLPSLDEQKMIGQYFSQLDNLITLHQRKCANLCSPSQVVFSLLFATSTFSWEQRKLGELVDVCSGRDYKHLSEGTIPVYGTGGYMLSVNDALSYDRDAIGIGRKGTIDRPYILKAPFWTVDTLFYAIPREKADLNFAFDIFQNIDWKKKDESTGVPSLSKTAINDIDVLAPKHGEQQTIGQFFAAIDHLITLHQRECISFTGRADRLILTANKKRTTSSWEQRKFDEVFDCTVPNNTLSRAELSYDEGTVLNVHYGDVLIKYGSVLDVQKDDIPRIPHRCREDFNGALLQDGDVIIADTAEDETTGKACEIGNLQGSAIVSGLHTMVCRPRNRMALGYLGYYLNSNAYHHQLLPLMQGIKVLSLSRSNIQKTSVSYPIAVKEQQLIAYYFSQLDNLITLHQRKPFLMKWRTSDANRNQTNRLVL